MLPRKKALSCLVCGRELENVHGCRPNQPSDGLAFLSHGHYGSFVFDPMDGHYLECAVCDPCLITAGAREQILLGRDRRPVIALEYRRENKEGPCDPKEADQCWRTLVGWQEADYPLRRWRDHLECEDARDELVIEESQIGSNIAGDEWLPS